MIAGVPCAGLNGVFYLLLVVLMPIRRLWQAVTRRNVPVSWGKILFLFSIAAGMTLMLWGEFEGIEHLDLFLTNVTGHSGFGARTAEIFEKIAPRVTYIPFVLLAIILCGVHVLRFALWLASKLTGRALSRS